MDGYPGRNANLVRGYGCGRFFGYAVLGLPVADGGADGVLGEDRAVNFYWRQGELFDDVGVGDRQGFGDGLALDPLGGEGAGGDGRAAGKGLELGVLDDLGLRVDADLEAHDVAALGCADEAGAYFGRALIERADVAGIFIVIDYFFAICHGVWSLSDEAARVLCRGARSNLFYLDDNSDCFGAGRNY